MLAVIVECASLADSEPRSIARALKRRDPDFITALVDLYHYRLLRYLVYLTSRRENAEDLVQETWMRVLERAGQYNGRSRFEPWLFSIARNLAIDYLRRMSKTTPHGDDAAQTAAADLNSPFLAAAKSEDATRIAIALESLDPIYREALLLRFQEDLSLDEVAQVTGAPMSTVSSRIYRGLSMMRSQLEGGSHGI